MLQTPLQYPTSIRVGGKIKDMISKEWKKCEALRLYDFDELLDNLDVCHDDEIFESKNAAVSQTWFPWASFTQVRICGSRRRIKSACWSPEIYSIACFQRP
jgi:hypothetical protein